LSLKAFRLTPMAIQLYKSGDFSAESIKDLKVTHDSLFEEVPIVIKNSHLVNELLLELSEQIPVESGCQFLDLGTADVLEEQLKNLIVAVDELNQVCFDKNLLCFYPRSNNTVLFQRQIAA
jgi:translation initiation factor 3 subunit H